MVGGTISLRDQRTGAVYPAVVIMAAVKYGNLRLSVSPGKWFEPTGEELKSLSVETAR